MRLDEIRSDQMWSESIEMDQIIFDRNGLHDIRWYHTKKDDGQDKIRSIRSRETKWDQIRLNQIRLDMMRVHQIRLDPMRLNEVTRICSD